uniref:Uncharacterized protein n=1 Tax=Anguilla anguilla TaxID=7936 RepID=A0A0E9T601_ANGAN
MNAVPPIKPNIKLKPSKEVFTCKIQKMKRTFL